MDILCPRTARIMARINQWLSSEQRTACRENPSWSIDAPGDVMDFQSYDATLVQAATAHQQYRILRKYEDAILVDGAEATKDDRKIVLEAEALKDFLSNETRLAGVDFESLGSSSIGTVLMYAKAHIRDCLGKFNPREFSACVGMTAGSSTSCTRANAHPVLKMKGRMHVTRNCALLAAHFLWDNEYVRACMFSRYGYDSVPSDWFDIVPGSKQFSVVKQWDKLRLAAQEADLNLILQKGIGNKIRRRLKRVGIDLDDATLNRHYARIGSRTGSLATVDLSNASNNILFWVVRELMPADWWKYIVVTRSPDLVTLDGEVHALQMISTMGNGFTFELESLLFWALARGVQDYLSISDRRLAVFGDDIVIHHECVPLLSDVFESLGMQVNHEKTYARGPYRESCGGYYFLGHDIKGFYVRKEVKTLGDACKLTNDVLGFCARVGILPPWKILVWLFKGEFNRTPPVVPVGNDERSGVFWWPVQGVRFSLVHQTYQYMQLIRKERKRLAVTSCRWSLAVRYLHGNLPGLVDPGYKPGHPQRQTLLFTKVGGEEVLRVTRGSAWPTPEYPIEWVADYRLFH